jgi:hypothetical protein
VILPTGQQQQPWGNGDQANEQRLQAMSITGW